MVAGEMPGVRFEPDTPQLHILDVKKGNETSEDCPHFSHSLDSFRIFVSWADYFRSTLATKFTGSHFAWFYGDF
jgi:hypothetical protein